MLRLPAAIRMGPDAALAFPRPVAERALAVGEVAGAALFGVSEEQHAREGLVAAEVDGAGPAGAFAGGGAVLDEVEAEQGGGLADVGVGVGAGRREDRAP